MTQLQSSFVHGPEGRELAPAAQAAPREHGQEPGTRQWLRGAVPAPTSTRDPLPGTTRWWTSLLLSCDRAPSLSARAAWMIQPY